MIRHLRRIFSGQKAEDARRKELSELKENISQSFAKIKADNEEQKRWINHLHANHKDMHAKHSLLTEFHQNHERTHAKDVEHLNRWIQHLHDVQRKQEEDTKKLEDNISFAFEKYNTYLIDLFKTVHELKTAKETASADVTERLGMRLDVQERQDISSNIPFETVESENTAQEETFTDTPVKHYANVLTHSEKKIIGELCKTTHKLSYNDLAMLTNLSSSTIKNHICHIKNKAFPLEEMNDANGIKRYYVPENIKNVLLSKSI